MPKARDDKYAALHLLKQTSLEADSLLDEFPSIKDINCWFASVKATLIQIRDCKSAKDIEYPPLISSLFKKEKSHKPNHYDNIGMQRDHVHDEKISSFKPRNIVENEKIKMLQHCRTSSKTPIKSAVDHSQNNAQSMGKKLEASGTLYKVITPVSNDNIQSTLETNLTKSVNKSTCLNVIPNSTENVQTPIMDKTFNKAPAVNLEIMKSGNAKSANRDRVTRSGSKRKSTVVKEGSNKKRKVDSKEITTPSASKSTHSKCNVEKSHNIKAIVTVSSNSKKSAVIVPPILKQTPSVSKEKQILKEIKKKEEKANENLKKVLAERQLKAEESKKKREEKREKLLEKRLKMEKEKEKQKREMEFQKLQSTKDVVKKSAMKPRVKELVEQNAKENTPRQCDSGDIVKTPVSRKRPNSDCYDMTPIPDSSAYNWSDSEDDHHKGKYIPLWAQGVHLKSALIQQYYHPPNTDEIFGNYIPGPDLTAIFQIQKKYYNIRTSSSQWHTPPDRFYRC